ncbi:uncharacterized protein LOC124923652 [Impatiens glandulifera]|uniref:uncharacterized protein LOC124923652 n=1 Tax=Impatiens glandulifera TaxID=253017 RepID=UPI001FB0B61C|nr:uncharacterized protein LOC124923652 [Impatiens glandulifera]
MVEKHSLMKIEDPTYSCKLTKKPLILLRGPPYSFSDNSDTFKCGLCDNCVLSGFSYGWKDVHRCFICSSSSSSYAHDHHLNCLTRSKFVLEKKLIEVKDDDSSQSRDDLIRLPVPDFDSINLILTRLVQQFCRHGSDVRDGRRHPWKIDYNENEKEDNKNINKFCQACTLPILATPYYYSDESTLCDFYLHKWCADLPEELKEHPSHPNHLLNLFMSTTPKDLSEFGVLVCNGCNFPINGYGYKCTECSSDYSLCIRCASLPSSILHEAHKHPLVLNSGSKDVKCAACCSDVYSSELATFTCDECGFGIHGTCALLPRTIKHRYDERHPFVLLYPTLKSVKDEDIDPSSQPFCEICERDVNYAKANDQGWLYHCEDCDMFGCVECFAMDMNFLSMIKPGCGDGINNS